VAVEPAVTRARQTSRRIALGGLCGLGLGVAWGTSWVARSASAGPPRAGWSPDPPVVPSKTQWVFTIRVRAGVPSIERVNRIEVKPAQGTLRLVGRYALELWVGTELLDRIRFNVPLGGDGPRQDDRPGLRRPSFDRVNTTLRVQMADHPRATTLRLVDRATAEVQTYAWPWAPPTVVADAGPGDAGAADAGAADAGAADAGAGDSGAGDAGAADDADAGAGDAGDAGAGDSGPG
jgi:hypothetical protein